MSQRGASLHRDNAARLDAAGQHDEAINELARGTRDGDADCMRLLGLRLLSGDRAPLLPAEALSFLDDLCARGEGEGAARAAGVLALGVRAPGDWKRALEWLRKSADAGWEPAQRQLLALCDDRVLAAACRLCDEGELAGRGRRGGSAILAQRATRRHPVRRAAHQRVP